MHHDGHRCQPRESGADRHSWTFLAGLSVRVIVVRPLGRTGSRHMLYAILCYNEEDVVWSWSKQQDDAVMARLGAIQQRLSKAGKLGPSLRLLPTTAATTLRKTSAEPLVIDGPFAETKEQLLGFFIVDVGTLEDALGIARELGGADTGSTYEIRPISHYFPDRRSTMA
jgi:hypothetical protein